MANPQSPQELLDREVAQRDAHPDDLHGPHSGVRPPESDTDGRQRGIRSRREGSGWRDRLRRGRLAGDGDGGDRCALGWAPTGPDAGGSPDGDLGAGAGAQPWPGRFAAPPAAGYTAWASRLLDLAVAVPVLVLASPVILGVALLVRLTMGSPVLFRQERRAGPRCSELVKFRTMRPAAPGDDGPESDGDRLTALGRVLRSTSLDELPTLLNVVRGDMSLWGRGRCPCATCPATPPTMPAATRSAPVSPAGRRSTGATRCPGTTSSTWTSGTSSTARSASTSASSVTRSPA